MDLQIRYWLYPGNPRCGWRHYFQRHLLLSMHVRIVSSAMRLPVQGLNLRKPASAQGPVDWSSKTHEEGSRLDQLQFLSGSTPHPRLGKAHLTWQKDFATAKACVFSSFASSTLFRLNTLSGLCSPLMHAPHLLLSWSPHPLPGFCLYSHVRLRAAQLSPVPVIKGVPELTPLLRSTGGAALAMGVGAMNLGASVLRMTDKGVQGDVLGRRPGGPINTFG